MLSSPSLMLFLLLVMFVCGCVVVISGHCFVCLLLYVCLFLSLFVCFFICFVLDINVVIVGGGVCLFVCLFVCCDCVVCLLCLIVFSCCFSFFNKLRAS